VGLEIQKDLSPYFVADPLEAFGVTPQVEFVHHLFVF
jgi:hypothetical protein